MLRCGKLVRLCTCVHFNRQSKLRHSIWLDFFFKFGLPPTKRRSRRRSRRHRRWGAEPLSHQTAEPLRCQAHHHRAAERRRSTDWEAAVRCCGFCEPQSSWVCFRLPGSAVLERVTLASTSKVSFQTRDSIRWIYKTDSVRIAVRSQFFHLLQPIWHRSFRYSCATARAAVVKRVWLENFYIFRKWQLKKIENQEIYPCMPASKIRFGRSTSPPISQQFAESHSNPIRGRGICACAASKSVSLELHGIIANLLCYPYTW